MRTAIAWKLMLALTLVVWFGCEPPKSTTEPAATEPTAETVEAPVEAAAPAAEPAPEMVREEATVGVGKQSDPVPVEPTAGDIITTPINTYFIAKEQVAFNIQIPQAMSLFKASEGRSPESEQEFFDKIIKANNINLPELPEGHKYVYDVAAEQLMVEHPQ